VLNSRFIALGGLGGSPLQIAALGLLPGGSPPEPPLTGPVLGGRPIKTPRIVRDEDEALLFAVIL
jgi:hypothetical protein